MRGRLLILSTDAVFARMLEIETRMMGFDVRACAAYDGEAADAVLCDLDSVPPTLPSACPWIIGFTRGLEVSCVDPDRRCAMILHRPFEMRMLREELNALGEEMPSAPSLRRQSGDDCRLEGGALLFNGQRVALSPTETLLMRALIEASPKPVSREALSAAIGESAGNKTDVYVCYLRRKLAAVSEKPLIRTVRGCGYLLKLKDGQE